MAMAQSENSSSIAIRPTMMGRLGAPATESDRIVDG